ncbi:MAG TPA: branched-chain amino acid ABC transporter permease [Actinomycetota bacterium]|nr:branched-chain amino acid ABC transporter permease [Actinomycetota bacterium]
MRSAIVTGIVAALIGLVLVLGGGAENGPNPFVTLGVLNGAIYGLVALGLVLVYKGTRVFNFAQGEFGTLAAFFLFFSIDSRYGGLPYPVGIAIALTGVLLIGLAMERVIIRPLINAPRVTVLVTTIAMALLLVGIEILAFKAEPRSLSPMIQAIDQAGNVNTIQIFDLAVEPQRLIGLGVLAAFGVMLAFFFSRTDLGLAVLATSQDSFATKVVGIGVERMSRFIWATAAVLGAVAGILYVPLTGALTPAVMTQNILIPAFTGAVLGGMTSLPGAFVGGVVIGFVQAVSLWASSTWHVGERAIQEILPGSEQLAILVVLLVVLLARPQGLLGRET